MVVAFQIHELGAAFGPDQETLRGLAAMAAVMVAGRDQLADRERLLNRARVKIESFQGVAAPDDPVGDEQIGGLDARGRM